MGGALWVTVRDLDKLNEDTTAMQIHQSYFRRFKMGSCNRIQLTQMRSAPSMSLCDISLQGLDSIKQCLQKCGNNCRRHTRILHSDGACRATAMCTEYRL